MFNGDESLMARDGVRLSPNTTPPGLDDDAYKAAMIGSDVDTTHELPMVFPDDFQPEALRGQTGRCVIEVKQVFDMIRPTEDELIKMVGATDKADLEAKVREDIQRQKQNQVNTQVELQVLEQIIANHEIEVPTRLVVDQINNRKNHLLQELSSQGVAQDDAVAQIEAQEEALSNEAIHNTKALFLLEDIAAAEDLGVQNEDVARKFQEIAQRNRTSVDEVQKYYQENNLLNQLAMEILELKVRAFLRENATITEVDPS